VGQPNEAIDEILEQPNLSYMKETILEAYEEFFRCVVSDSGRMILTEQQHRKLAADMDRAARRKGLSQAQREDYLKKARSAFGCWPESRRS
jgi:hypothetical protein